MNPAPRGAALFVVVGEVSGDIQAAKLVTELRRRDSSVSITGFGGSHLGESGVTLLEDSTSWGVIGHVAPVLRLPMYLRALARVEAAVRDRKPDTLLLVDFAAFNLRLAERLRGAVPIAYYFPPMVSIRKGNRARKVARLGMRILATLRREAEAYERAGGDVVLVGHPVMDLTHQATDLVVLRRRLNVPEGSTVVGLLPGSREQEIGAHLPVILEAARLVRARVPSVRFALPVPARELRSMVERHVRTSSVPVQIAADSEDVMRISALVITAAGTATLEATALGVPMIVVYRLPWVSWVIARQIVTIGFAALPNILAGREIVPELLQNRMTPLAIADTAQDLLRNSARRAAMQEDLQRVARDLGEPGAAGRAASEVLLVLDRVASHKARG